MRRVLLAAAAAGCWSGSTNPPPNPPVSSSGRSRLDAGTAHGPAAPLTERDALDAAATEFVDAVTGTHGAIQRCYEHILASDPSLQGHDTTIHIAATFIATRPTSLHATPSLGGVFDGCLSQVAARWVVTHASSEMTFTIQVTLSPTP